MTTANTNTASTTSSIFGISKLAEDGSDWPTWRRKAEAAFGARLGLMAHIDGRAVQPTMLEFDLENRAWKYTDIARSEETPTAEEVTAFETKYDLWIQRENLIKNQLWSTIPARLQLLVQNYKTTYEIWNAICEDNETKSDLAKADLRQQLQSTICDEDGNVREHITKMLHLRETLAICGDIVTDSEFISYLTTLLPARFHTILTAVTASALANSTQLTVEAILLVIQQEVDFDQNQRNSGTNLEQTGNALSVVNRFSRGRARGHGQMYNRGQNNQSF